MNSAGYAAIGRCNAVVGRSLAVLPFGELVLRKHVTICPLSADMALEPVDSINTASQKDNWKEHLLLWQGKGTAVVSSKIR
jgi:hypothetical protein